MLVKIDNHLRPEVESLCEDAPLKRFRCMTNLLQAHADGRHIAVIHPSICRVLEDCQRLSEEQRAVAKKIRAKYFELAELPNILQTYARLSFDDGLPSLANGVWSIPIDWLANYGLSEANLICEDLYDCDICQEAATDFLALNGLNSLRLKFDPTAGGGGNTHRVLRSKAITGQKISICVVDSDKASPDDALQAEGTAGKCMEVNEPGVYQVLISPGRELENHIPSRLLDKVHATWEGDIPSNSHIRLNQIYPNITLHHDMKGGIKRWHINAMNGINRAYWEAAQHALGVTSKCGSTMCQKQHSGDCSTTVLHPIGRSLLRLTGEHLKSQENNPKRYIDYLPSPNDSFWRAIGATVAAYCVAPKTTALI